MKPWRLLFGALLGAVAIALLFNEDFLRISGLVYTVAALVAGGVIGSPLSRR